MAVVGYHEVHALRTDNPVGVNISVVTQCHATAEKATAKDDGQNNAFKQQNIVSDADSTEPALSITIRLAVTPPTIGNSCFFWNELTSYLMGPSDNPCQSHAPCSGPRQPYNNKATEYPDGRRSTEYCIGNLGT